MFAVGKISELACKSFVAVGATNLLLESTLTDETAGDGGVNCAKLIGIKAMLELYNINLNILFISLIYKNYHFNPYTFRIIQFSYHGFQVVVNNVDVYIVHVKSPPPPAITKAESG